MPEKRSFASTPAVRRRMQEQRTHDTEPELQLRRLLHAAGLRYRVNCRVTPTLKSRADIVFGPSQVAVFVDGCFWHGCPEHYRTPAANAAYWEPKIAGNRLRDADTDRLLAHEGWLVLRFWEHEDMAIAAGKVAAAVRSRHPARVAATPRRSRS